MNKRGIFGMPTMKDYIMVGMFLGLVVGAVIATMFEFVYPIKYWWNYYLVFIVGAWLFVFILASLVVLVSLFTEKIEQWRHHEHVWLPIRYGLLTRVVDEKGRIIKPKEYIEGGCCSSPASPRWQCKKCGEQR